MYNVLITNVPGPQVPLYAAGFPVDAMYPVAPLAIGQALAVSCTSYNGEVFFGMTADRDAIPDVEEFADADPRGDRASCASCRVAAEPAIGCDPAIRTVAARGRRGPRRRRDDSPGA